MPAVGYQAGQKPQQAGPSCYTITPKTLENLLSLNKNISFIGCFTQLNIFIFLASTECFLLSSMAYDRYIAICKPLHYPIIMSSRCCLALLTGSYMIGTVDSSADVFAMIRLHFCKFSVTHHFYCDSSPLLSLSCSDTNGVEIIIFIFAGSTILGFLITISVSYVSILSTILKINSTSGRHKVFSTSASHLLGVIVFDNSLTFTYLKPSKSYSLGKDQVASVFYTIVFPMLNPLLYSFRNKEEKGAVVRSVKRQESRKLR